MAKTDTTRIDALEAILAEKRKHEGYLAKLEERRGTTPAHVFNRLHDEYLTKLTDLQVRASMESESLHERLRADEEALAEIEARLGAAAEERVEGELRAEVGEYDAKEWATRLEALNAQIAGIEKERAATAGAVERTREMLTEARGSAVEPMAAPAVVSTTAPSPVRASVPTPAPAASVVAPSVAASPALAPAARPTPMAQPKVEEVAANAPETATAVKTPAQGSPMAGSPSFDELAFLNSVVGRASTPVKSDGPDVEHPSGVVRSVAAPAAPPAAAPAPRVSAAVKAPEPAPVAEPESALGRPTPRSSQAIKTLKCQECGTLNYPTEWYCERCGGELAAL